MDEHIDTSITIGLRRRGVDVLTVQQDGRRGKPDPDLLDRAGFLQRVVFTQDRDFLREAHRRQLANIPFVGVVYSYNIAVSIGQCIQDLEIIAKVFDLVDMADRVEYLPL